MSNIFELADKTGKTIVLTKERWSHIVQHHPDVSDKLEEVKLSLTTPTVIVPHKYDDKTANYYRYQKETRDHMLTIVKYLNGNGFIKSAFFTQKLVRR